MARGLAPSYVIRRGLEDFYLEGSLELKGGLVLGTPLNASEVNNDSGVTGAEVAAALDALAGAVAPVDSVFGRVGAVVAALSDYDASQIDNDSAQPGTDVANALDLLAATVPPVAPVDSVHGRTGIVAAALSDYDASQVDNDSLVAGATVKDALDNLSGVGATTFQTLTDTPANFTGSSLLGVRVNVGETALEFAAISAGIDPTRDFFIPTLGQTAFVLSAAPLDDADVQAFVNGNKVPLTGNYTVVGTAFTWLDTVYTLDTADQLEIVYFV